MGARAMAAYTRLLIRPWRRYRLATTLLPLVIYLLGSKALYESSQWGTAGKIPTEDRSAGLKAMMELVQSDGKCGEGGQLNVCTAFHSARSKFKMCIDIFTERVVASSQGRRGHNSV
jgi:hypothetical protein